MSIPTVSYWCGEPMAEMTVERLIEIVCEQQATIDRLRDESHRRSIQHITDLASMARANRARKAPLLTRLFASEIFK